MAASIIVRARSLHGVTRFEMRENSLFSELQTNIASAWSIPSDAQIVSLDESLSNPITNGYLTLKECGFTDGTMVHVSDSRSAGSSAVTGNRCNHPPQFTCIHCAKFDFVDKKKCDHGPSATCPNCMSSDLTGEKLTWLCRHGPNARCPNCPEKKKKKSRSTDGGGTGSGSSSSTKSGSAGSSSQGSSTSSSSSTTNPPSKPRCTHGPNMKCTNCIDSSPSPRTTIGTAATSTTTTATTSTGTGGSSVATPYRCRNHGPNGSCIDCLKLTAYEMLEMKAQGQSVCTGLAIDNEAANQFQLYVLATKFKPRVGIMYGRVESDGSVKVEVIYEPPQSEGPNGVSQMLDDPKGPVVDELANLLGLTKVGWVTTKGEGSYPLSATDILRAAALQRSVSGPFVTVTISGQGNSTRFDALELSQQAIQMYTKGQFVAPKSPELALLASPVLVEKAETLQVPVEFLLVNVPISSFSGGLCKRFPVSNRVPPVALSDLKVHMINVSDKPYIDRISDFHLLLYLTEHLDIRSDMPNLCFAVQLHDGDLIGNFKDIIDAVAQI